MKAVEVFWTVCLPTRLFLAYLAYRAEPKVPNVYILIAFLIGVAFLFHYLNKTNYLFFGKPVWWNYLRPIHGVLWCLYAFLAYRRVRGAYLILLLDVMIGAAVEFCRYSYEWE